MAERVVVVTGAGHGIGRATAEAFGQQGNHLVLAARTEAELEAAAEAVRAAGGTASVVPCDVTAEPHVKRLVEIAASRTGMIDVVVCNAGTAVVAPFTKISLSDWDQTLRTTLTGTFLLCKHAVAHMHQGGQLFLLASIAGRIGFPNWSAYGAAKSGVLGFARSIRAELRSHGIRVTVVIPGAVDTPLWEGIPGEWNRAHMLHSGDIARAIVRAADEPPYVSIEEIVLGHISGAL